MRTRRTLCQRNVAVFVEKTSTDSFLESKHVRGKSRHMRRAWKNLLDACNIDPATTVRGGAIVIRAGLFAASPSFPFCFSALLL
jgi:hypothetical protein